MAELDPKLLEQIQHMRENMELHELYKKHQGSVRKIKDVDGDEVEDETDTTYIDWNTKLCVGCGMPIGNTNEIDESAIGSFMSSNKKLKHPAAYVLCMEKCLENRKKVNRCGERHLTIDDATVLYKDYFKHAKIRKQLIDGCIEGDGSIDHAYKNLVRYEENILGKVTPETTVALLEHMKRQTERDSWRIHHKVSESAALYMALALRHDWKPDRALLGLLMRKCKDFRLKQELTAKLGQFRVSAMRGTEFADCLPSYHYCKKYKPELLENEAWVAKKFRFDKHHENRLVALRYYIDYGKGLENLAKEDAILTAAIARFIPDKYPQNVAALTKWRKNQEKGDAEGYRFVFGTDTDRRELYTIDTEYHLIHMSTDIEMFFHYMLDENMRRQTDNPANDMLAPQPVGVDED